MTRILKPLLVLAALLAFGGTAPAGDDADAPPSWKRVRLEFRRDFADRDEGVKCRALLDLRRGRHPEAVDLLLDLLRDDDLEPALRAHATVALRGAISDEGLKRLRKAYDHDRAKPELRSAILLACGERDDAETRSLLKLGLEGDDALVRTAAVDALGSIDRPGLEEALRARVSDDAWTVRAAAIRGLSDRGDRGGMLALIPRLELEENGRLRWEVHTALKELSGEDFGFDPELWTLWAKSGKRSPPDETKYATPRFYGLRVLGERPVFVVDLSASMLQPLTLSPQQRRDLVEARGKTRLDWSKIESKLDLAKAELAASLEELREEVSFGLVFYSDSVVVWRGELAPATRANIRAAIKRVKGLGAGGNTNVHDALLEALALETKRGGRRGPPQHTDQILFLTDGRANRGGVQDRDAIRTLHRELHRLTRVRFDCVGLGAHDRDLLEGLAADCGGRYVSVGD